MTEKHIEISAYVFEQGGPVDTVYVEPDADIKSHVLNLGHTAGLGECYGLPESGFWEFENGWCRSWLLDGPIPPEEPKKKK